MRCNKCAGQGKLNYNPFQYPTDIHPCNRCGGSGVEPDIAYEDYIALTKEIEQLKAELMDAKVRGNAFRDVAKKLKTEIERKDDALMECASLADSIKWVCSFDGDIDDIFSFAVRIMNERDEALTKPEEDGE